MEKTRNPWRLSRDVEPETYHIGIRPDLEKFTFSGTEEISVRVKKPTETITMHALDLKVRNALILADGPARAAKQVTFDKKFETMTLHLDRAVMPGRATIILDFEGDLNDKMHGFYRTSYNVNGKKRWGAATQFGATDARRCFPCWDEPDMKAVFKVELTVPHGYTAPSNMPGHNEEPPGSFVRVVYEPTPKMSTYLLAFVVAELEHVEAPGPRGIPIRVWTTPENRDPVACALQGRICFADCFHLF